MALYSTDENLSDDEVFFGKLSLKEVKKHIFNPYRQTISCTTENNEFLSDDSVRVIETQSEPDIYSVRDTVASPEFNSNTNFSPRTSMDWDIKSTDDSFLRLEEMVTKLCMSPKKNIEDELDNTLEVVEFILNNAPSNDNGNGNEGVEILDNKIETEKNCNIYPEIITSPIQKFNNTEVKNENVESQNNKIECKSITHLQIEMLYETPLKDYNLDKQIQNTKTETISTPLVEAKHTKEIFKTPKNPASSKKHQKNSTKKTPGKTSYQHITSPVASYIKNCPQVPLLKDVHPKKPLPGSSSIPKLLKNVNDNKVGNKENVLLPSIAYKSAKKRKVISIPDKEKMPQSPWAKRLASSLPKPFVIKHDHREMYSMKRTISQQEDSFANLSLHQADVSVCTQKSAIAKPL